MALPPSVGRTPWSARVPLDPLLTNKISLSNRDQADEGVGRRPGGLPHEIMPGEMCTSENTKWLCNTAGNIGRVLRPAFYHGDIYAH